jgi:hypothetical protein
VNDPIPSIPVVDVDQPYPNFMPNGGRPSTSSRNGDGQITSTIENALRDVLGWRPRARDTSAFEAALTASFQLSEVEDHVVATYSPRGFAMQADLGAVTGGQASLYSRASAGRTQMLMLLDGLTPLRPDADTENCNAFRGLVRAALAALVNELGTPGGPRVAVVDSYLRQLFGGDPAKIDALTNADDVAGQLGQLRVQFGLEDGYVNNPDQEGIRTSFWTLVDLALDINRAWQALRSQFTRANQRGFLGTDLVLINRLLSATAEQVDEVESALDSVFVSGAERQTIAIGPDEEMTVDEILSWTRIFVTEDGPRIARDAGRDGIATSFTPTVHTIQQKIRLLMKTISRQSFTLPPQAVRLLGAALKGPIQAPLVNIESNSHPSIPPGMKASRIQVAIASLDSLLVQLLNTATRISRFPEPLVIDAAAVTILGTPNVLLALRVSNLGPSPSQLPVFRSHPDRRFNDVLPVPGNVSYDDDTVSAIFVKANLTAWLRSYNPPGQLPQLADEIDRQTSVTFQAEEFPVSWQDGVTGT